MSSYPSSKESGKRISRTKSTDPKIKGIPCTFTKTGKSRIAVVQLEGGQGSSGSMPWTGNSCRHCGRRLSQSMPPFKCYGWDPALTDGSVEARGGTGPPSHAVYNRERDAVFQIANYMSLAVAVPTELHTEKGNVIDKGRLMTAPVAKYLDAVAASFAPKLEKETARLNSISPTVAEVSPPFIRDLAPHCSEYRNAWPSLEAIIRLENS
jgi:hypothetical protein